MYEVKVYHYKPHYRKGDLEDTTELINSKVFKLRKDAKSFIEKEVRGKKTKGSYSRGNTPSYIYYYTGKTWIHENTGEECSECISYVLQKLKVD